MPLAQTADDIEPVLRHATFPLFLKPIMGVASSGAILVHGISGGDVDLGTKTVPVAEFFDTVLGPIPYLAQGYVSNHPGLSGLSTHLATVRCYNFIAGDALTVRWTLLKLRSEEHTS